MMRSVPEKSPFDRNQRPYLLQSDTHASQSGDHCSSALRIQWICHELSQTLMILDSPADLSAEADRRNLTRFFPTFLAALL